MAPKLSNIVNRCLSYTSRDDVDMLVIHHAKFDAEISLFGGQLLMFEPTDSESLIWLSDNAFFDKSAPIRGGIPLCWPWFGKAQSPSHGFLRTSEWRLDGVNADSNGVVVELILCESAHSLSIWPHHFEARLIYQLGQTLTVTLSVTNTDCHAWSFTGALHSYFKVDDIEQVQLLGLGQDYIDNRDGARVDSEALPVSITGEVDRTYLNAESKTVIKDIASGRDIVVSHRGQDAVVVWNPWADLSKSMGDMSDDGYQTMLCVETARVGSPVTLAPSETYTLSTHVEVRL